MGVGVTWYCRTCKVYTDLPYGSYRYLDERRRQHIPKGHQTHDTIEYSSDWCYGIEGGVLYAMGPYGTRGDVLIDFNKDGEYRRVTVAPKRTITRADLVTDAQRRLWDSGVRRWPNCPNVNAPCYSECEDNCKPLSEWFE